MAVEDPPLRVGFVGAGGVATRHARVLSGFPDVVLTAATDVDPARGAAFAVEFGTAVAADVPALLGHGLDAVYVCVPPFAHVPAAASAEVQVAAAGLPLFVEKPLAPDLATAEEIGRRLDDAGVITRVGHHWRCAEPVARARALLAGRPVRLVSAAWWDKVPPVSWWPHRELSGGPVVEQAIHVLDLVRVLVGEVTEVFARAGGAVAGGDVDAATTALLTFECGAVGTLTTASVLGAKHRAGVEVVADGLVVGLGEDWLEVREGTDAPTHAGFDRWTACVAADRAFVDAAAGRRMNTAAGRPSDTAASRPSDTAAGRPSDTAAGRPSDTAAGRPSDTAAGRPSDTAAGRPMNTAAGRPMNTAAGRTPPGPALPDYAEALRSHRLATAVARSAASGRPERVS